MIKLFRRQNLLIQFGIIIALLLPAGYFGSGYVTKLLSKTNQNSLPLASIIPDRYLDQTKRNNLLFGNIVTLKTIKEDYIEAYHDMFSADVRHGLSFTAPVDDEDYTIQYVSWTLSRQAQGELMCYAIFDNKDDCLVGAIEVRAHHSQDPGQLGCWINDKYRGGGRMQEALKLITQEYFRITGAPCISACIESFNIASHKALTKFGFKQKYNPKKFKKPYTIAALRSMESSLSCMAPEIKITSFGQLRYTEFEYYTIILECIALAKKTGVKSKAIKEKITRAQALKSKIENTEEY